MEAVWFAIVSAMLAVYVVLDGFDFGAGILHRFVAKTDAERRTVLAAIGPVYDANEVWLIAAGGVLLMAFPRTYSAAFSGFYLALMIVLWLLILRGIAIEARSHQENPLWREFWDTVFSLSSALLAVVLGTSLGNVVRGVPVDQTGFFAMPLFTNFRPGERPGVFDWYTILVGFFTLCLLAGHGALYLAWKTAGPVQERSQAWARKAWLAVLALWGAVTLATALVQPTNFTNLLARPWSLGLVLMMAGGLWGVFHFSRPGRLLKNGTVPSQQFPPLRKGGQGGSLPFQNGAEIDSAARDSPPFQQAARRELAAFLSSSAFILGLMAATLAGNYPFWLRSTLDPAYSLTAANTASTSYAMQVGLVWWTVGIMLAGGYFAFVFHSFRGKVDSQDDSDTGEHGH